MSELSVSPNVLNAIRAITKRPGWTAEPVVIFSSPGQGLRLTAGPGGRGVPRPTYLIIAPTLADCFRALSECLDLI